MDFARAEAREPPFGTFDERLYYEANPDVAQAYQRREGCGLLHFLEHGHRERRPGVSPELARLAAEVMGAGHALPPRPLVERVNGNPEPASFEFIGRRVAIEVFMAVSGAFSRKGRLRILDFGCGCGRITRHLPVIFPNADVLGVDIDAEAVDWCRGHLHGVRFDVGPGHPPSPFPSGSFDLVLAVSVFSHLPEALQAAWLPELARITADDGRFVASYVSDHFAPVLLTGDESRTLADRGFVYHTRNGTQGLPAFYQASFQTRDYVAREWGRHFRILADHPRGLNQHQELVVARPARGAG